MKKEKKKHETMQNSSGKSKSIKSTSNFAMLGLRGLLMVLDANVIKIRE